MKRTVRLCLSVLSPVFLLTAVLLTATRPVRAEVYFVRSGGDDGNAGTSWTAAFATLTRASQVLAAGDTVAFAAGDTLVDKATIAVSATLFPVESRDSLNPVPSNRLFVLGEPEATNADALIKAVQPCDTLRLEHIAVNGNLDGDTDPNNAAYGIYAAGSAIVANECRVENCFRGFVAIYGGVVIAHDPVIRGNGSGFRITLAGRLQVRGGISTGNGEAFSTNGEGAIDARGMLCHGSTNGHVLVESLPAGFNVQLDQMTLDSSVYGVRVLNSDGNVTIRNSIVAENDTGLINVASATLVNRYNLFHANGVDTLATGDNTHLLFANPFFAHPHSNDFRLLPFSSARYASDTGSWLGARPPVERADGSWGRSPWMRGGYSRPAFGR